MPRRKSPAYLGFVAFVILLSALVAFRPSLRAQTGQAQNSPAAGTTVAVKMVDAVDSASDPAGKQYRASVSNAVNAGNGVAIAKGAAATVTLGHNGSGWVAQLSSVVINDQAVAVTSDSASVTSAAQNTAKAVGSVLGSFGRTRNVPGPPSATAVATGQRVILPPGTALSFVLGASPAANPVAAAPAAPALATNAQPQPASAAPAPAAGGALTAMYICFSNQPPNPSDLNYRTEFLTAAFEVPVNTQGAIPAIEPAFSAYLKTAYQYPNAGITCQPIWSIADAQTAQKKISHDRDTAKLKMVNTGWGYGQPAVTQGHSGFDPLAQGPGGLDLSQHRLTTYYCALDAAGGTSMTTPTPYNAQVATRYISQVFQADWDSAAVDRAYDVYIRDQYVHDLSLADTSTRCVALSPALAVSLHQSSTLGSKLIRHIVPVDFSDSPAQAAAAQNIPAAPAAAPAAGGSFISCSTSGGAGIDTYLTGVFQTTHPVRHLPSGANLVDQGVLDRFYAYLKQQGYNFKPGSDANCAIAPTEAEAETAKHKRYYEGGGCSTCGKTVETGWKDTQ